MIFRPYLLELLEHIDSPISLGIALRLKYELRSLPEVLPRHYVRLSRTGYPYDDIHAYRLDKQALAFLSKSDLDFGIDTKLVAITKANLAEEQCSRYNDILSRWQEGSFEFLDRDFQARISRARVTISNVLGDLCIPTVLSLGSFGPGNDLDTKSNRTSVYDKMRSAGSITPKAVKYLGLLPARIRTHPSMNTYDLQTRLPIGLRIVDSNRSTTVPKTFKTQRYICVEPRWNVYFQKGVGRYIRNRLKRFGVDLDDQSLNRSLAATAEVRRLSTIDLESASDTLNIEIVRMLLPDFWFTLLNDLRSPCTDNKLNGKFSSMGNGFTFELESLIFFSLAKACSPDTLSVYGDDVIVDQKTARKVLALFTDVGFKVNADKTFLDGAFYESCGLDSFKGEYVSPIYFKKLSKTSCNPVDLINQLYELANNFSGSHLFFDRAVWDIRRKFAKAFGLFPDAPRSSSGVWDLFTEFPITDSGCEGVRHRKYGNRSPGFKPRNYDSAVVQSFLAPFTDEISQRGISLRTFSRKKVFTPTRLFRRVYLA